MGKYIKEVLTTLAILAIPRWLGVNHGYKGGYKLAQSWLLRKEYII